MPAEQFEFFVWPLVRTCYLAIQMHPCKLQQTLQSTGMECRAQITFSRDTTIFCISHHYTPRLCVGKQYFMQTRNKYYKGSRTMAITHVLLNWISNR